MWVFVCVRACSGGYVGGEKWVRGDVCSYVGVIICWEVVWVW